MDTFAFDSGIRAWPLLYAALMVMLAGFCGGVLNAFITDKGFVQPYRKIGPDSESIVEPGWIGNAGIGAMAALGAWALSGSISNISLVGIASGTSVSDLSLRVTDLATALLVGVAGSKWFSAEVDNNVLKQLAVVASVSPPDPNLARNITLQTPQAALVSFGQEASGNSAGSTAAQANLAMVSQRIPAPTGTSKFPASIIALAQEAQRQTNCLASVTLAQWAEESGYGKNAPHNNPFGIKWVENCGYGCYQIATTEVVQGRSINTFAKFIWFPRVLDAFIYHGKLLMDPNGPYRAALQFATDWQKFVQAIGPIYATNPQYSANLLSIIASNQLYRYDSINLAAPADNISVATNQTVPAKSSTGETA